MASLRKRVSKWMLRSNDGAPVSACKNNDQDGTMNLDRGSLDSGYHSLRALENQHCIPKSKGDIPKSSPRRLHKALSTSFNYLSETVRSGAAYIYSEPTREDKNSPLEWSELESQTPRKGLKRRSSIFSSLRRGKTQHFSSTVDSQEAPSDNSPTRRIVTDDVPVLGNLEIPESVLPKANIPPPGETTLAVRLKPPESKQLWPNPVKVALGNVSPERISKYEPASALPEDSYAESTCDGIDRIVTDGRLPFMPSALTTFPISNSSKGYFSDGRYYVTEIKTGQLDSQSTRDSVDGKSTIPPQSPDSHIENTTYHGSAEDLPSSHGSANSSDCEINNASLLASAYHHKREFSDTSPPNMGSRAIWEQKRAARHQEYLSICPLASADTLIDDIFEPSLKLTRSPARASLKETDIQDSQPPDSLRFAVEAIDSKSGLEYDADDSAPESDSSVVGPYKATNSIDAETQSFTKPGFRDSYIRENFRAWVAESRSSVEHLSQRSQQSHRSPPIAASSEMEALNSELTESNLSPLLRADTSKALVSRPRVVTVFKHDSMDSGSDDITEEDCAITTRGSSSIPPAYTHFRSSPVVVRRDLLEDLRAHEGRNFDISGTEKSKSSPSESQTLPRRRATPTQPVYCNTETCDEGKDEPSSTEDCFPGRPKTMLSTKRTLMENILETSPERESVVSPLSVYSSSDIRFARIVDLPIPGTISLLMPTTIPTGQRTPLQNVSENVRSVISNLTPDTKPKIGTAQSSPTVDANTQYGGHEAQPFINQKSKDPPTDSEKGFVCREPEFKQSPITQRSEIGPVDSNKCYAKFASRTAIASPTTSPDTKQSKKVSFAPDTEFVDSSSPTTPKKSPKKKKKKKVSPQKLEKKKAAQQNSEAKKELTLQKLTDSLVAAGLGPGALESTEDERPKEKSRMAEPERVKDVEGKSSVPDSESGKFVGNSGACDSAILGEAEIELWRSLQGDDDWTDGFENEYE